MPEEKNYSTLLLVLLSLVLSSFVDLCLYGTELSRYTIFFLEDCNSYRPKDMLRTNIRKGYEIL